MDKNLESIFSGTEQDMYLIALNAIMTLMDKTREKTESIMSSSLKERESNGESDTFAEMYQEIVRLEEVNDTLFHAGSVIRENINA